ncbi:glycosyltransferase family 4 protein [Janthinobacterium fluminis]|uniref:Glycosyltransferase family 4 protein n=1 Tax=Janthinobacterium fluminis TaxID=2987524 RepID=A0ABT5K1L8_9BURK|nr:glycosyltransferase family 4 protein [Janthinobacterium fluminis]MDC8758874.1 glycosyltransferase family 4 protein [Janthinobacterium fluminis]
MTIKILYIDGDGPFGGASRSLFEAVRALPAGAVAPLFVASEGTALDFYRQVASGLVTARGMPKFDNTRYSHYRGVRWLILLRELFHLPFAVIALLKAKRRWQQVDLIHVNEGVYLVTALLAKAIFRAPLVVHVRALMWAKENSLRCAWFNRSLARHAAAVISINENTRATLPAALPVDVIQNSFTAKRAPEPDTAMAAKLDGLRKGSLKVGFVGNLHHSKGLFDMLDAAVLLKRAGHDVEFVIVGGVTVADKGPKAWLLARAGLAQNVAAELAGRIAAEGLDASFHLMGATLDISCVYERIDVLCFASHYDAPGRPVFEAAFSGVPSIVAVDRPLADTLVDGETGLAIPARQPARLAQAIAHYAEHRDEVKRMGENARRLAQDNFDPAANARRLLGVYQRVLGPG